LGRTGIKASALRAAAALAVAGLCRFVTARHGRA
jgi:hypothetical protein